MQTGNCAVVGIIHPCIQTTEIAGDSPRSGEQGLKLRLSSFSSTPIS
jgi:hypothetical protein